jgi:hypothetical protein
MTPAQIRRRRSTLTKKIETAQAQIRQLQASCPHPNVQKEYGSNTGNYDPSADSYWIDWNCPDCGKRWTTDQ